MLLTGPPFGVISVSQIECFYMSLAFELNGHYIASRWIVAQSIGVLIASLIINRRLYLIASVSQVSTSRQDRLRAMWFDLALGFGMPIIWVGLCKYWLQV